MIRKYFKGLETSSKDKIKWRSHEPHRIEAFSDAVFAFVISLLVFSLEVPKSSEELLKGLWQFFPFMLCFIVVFLIWFFQYKFFRRYGMHDILTIVLNATLIFVVLFYVYPLKFLFSASFMKEAYTIREQDYTSMVILYNSGFTVIYLLFTLMYSNAYFKRTELALSPVEIFETRTHMYGYLYVVSVGCVTIIVALFGGKYAVISMGCYALMGGMGIFSSVRDKRFHKKFGSAPKIEPDLGEEG